MILTKSGERKLTRLKLNWVVVTVFYCEIICHMCFSRLNPLEKSSLRKCYFGELKAEHEVSHACVG